VIPDLSALHQRHFTAAAMVLDVYPKTVRYVKYNVPIMSWKQIGFGRKGALQLWQ
jgi:hypothetical protein